MNISFPLNLNLNLNPFARDEGIKIKSKITIKRREREIYPIQNGTSL